MKSALLIDNHSLHTDELANLLCRLGFEDIHQMDYSNAHDCLHDHDLIVLSGASDLFPVMHNEDKLEREIQLVLESQKPVIGICYGCQLVARAFGGEMQPLETPREQELIALEWRSHIDEISRQKVSTVYESRKNYLAVVPDCFEVCAVSDDTPEVILHDQRPIAGVMFHPEVSLGHNDGEVIMKNLIHYLMQR